MQTCTYVLSPHLKNFGSRVQKSPVTPCCEVGSVIEGPKMKCLDGRLDKGKKKCLFMFYLYHGKVSLPDLINMLKEEDPGKSVGSR